MLHTSHHEHGQKQHHYRGLLNMAALSFASMYALMYAMVDAFGNVYNSLNQVYMAGLMTAPMIAIELVVMRGMYQDKRRNGLILGGAIVAGVAFFAFIRWQTQVTDRQFLRSMIPHHAGAILMCEQAPIRDPEIKKLCGDIIKGQQAEIDQMKAKLRQLNE
ncbi:MAG TPA: DUF305 domain-containing protein [Vicinamibacterales bacterium]|nr:DUF305 domain-containing protein [Vicinamibacterales bacterium]HEX2461466.1 DUF305 domain-containing protein [Vicinamibacterales bacterium]